MNHPTAAVLTASTKLRAAIAKRKWTAGYKAANELDMVMGRISARPKVEPLSPWYTWV